MKKTLLIISAASLLLAGCSKEQLVEERSYTGPVTVVGATFESLTEDGTTKAAVTDAGTFTWQNGDKAAFAESSSSTSYCFGTNSADGATASFAIEGEHTFTASSLAIYPNDLTTDQVPTNLKVKVPASRVWVNEQTNVAMYGKYETASSSFSFSHMGGLVRVRVKNVPTNAREFVFKASGCKINGEFSVNTVSESKVIETVASDNEDEQTYTLTWTTAPTAENTTDFYIPLPLGTYSGGFAFYLKDEGHNVLYSKVGSTSQTIARKKLLLMPAITLVGGSIEPIEKAAVVANIPAGYSGDFLLPQSEKVLLKINASTEDHNITLKYDGGTLPTNLEIQVIEGNAAGNYNAVLSGNLPQTHVDFTLGHIDNTSLTTSSSTLAVINPATVATLTVKGGNVLLQGATVNSIVVDAEAKADGDKAPVEIVMEKVGDNAPSVTSGITANADVIVAPKEAAIEVQVTPAANVNVATEGEGTVKNGDQKITTKAAAKIGDIKYITLADAVKAAPTNATSATTIILLEDVTDGAGIFLGAADKKNIIIDLNDKTYTASTPVGSAGTVNQAFHLEKGNTIKIQNGTLNVDVNKKTDFRFIIQNYADLTLEGVTLDGSNLAKTDKVCYTVSNNSGAVEFKDFGDIKTNITAPDGGIAFDVCKYASYEVPTVTWNSTGTVTGGIELSGGKIVVASNLAVDRPIVAIDDKDVQSVSSTLTINSGATISTASSFKDLTPGISGPGVTSLVQVRRGADLTIDGAGSIEAGAQTYSAVMVTVNNDNDEKTAKLTVNGQVTITGDYYGIVGNGSRHNTEITVKGGTIRGTHASDNYGIYHPQAGKLTITGGTIEGYSSAVEVRGGTVNISGGSLTATAPTFTCNANGNGTTTVGAALAIAQHNTKKDISVTITGGTFTGVKALNESNPQDNDPAPQVTMSISKGTFNGEISTADVTHFIHGGTFSSQSNVEYVGEEMIWETLSDGTYTYSSKQAPGTSGTNNENRLLKDLSTSQISLLSMLKKDKNIILDLGGNTLTLTANSNDKSGILCNNGIGTGNVVTIKNGTINFSNGKVAIQVNKCTFNLESDLTVNSNAGCVLVTGSGVLNSKATLITTGEGHAAIQTNGNDNLETTINITGGQITSVDAGIYHPAGTLNISGGAITGTTGVYVKSGVTTISGGTIKGTGADAAYTYKSDGCNSTGDALVVDNCGYPGGAPSVTLTNTVTAGTLVSTNASQIGNYYGNGQTEAATITNNSGVQFSTRTNDN